MDAGRVSGRPSALALPWSRRIPFKGLKEAAPLPVPIRKLKINIGNFAVPGVFLKSVMTEKNVLT
jgi:hypothetical protein